MSEENFLVYLSEGEMIDILRALEKRAEALLHVPSIAQRITLLRSRLERIYEGRDKLEEEAC